MVESWPPRLSTASERNPLLPEVIHRHFDLGGKRAVHDNHAFPGADVAHHFDKIENVLLNS